MTTLSAQPTSLVLDAFLPPHGHFPSLADEANIRTVVRGIDKAEDALVETYRETGELDMATMLHLIRVRISYETLLEHVVTVRDMWIIHSRAELAARRG